MKKTLLCFILILCFAFNPLCANAVNTSALGVCVIDYGSGEFLYEKSADIARPPASMTKIMTLYILYEMLADGSVTKDTRIKISDYAASLSRSVNTTNIPLSAGAYYSVEELIDAIAAVSACAACSAFAEYVCGSEKKFASLMNSKASELGLSAYFADSSGLSEYNSITPRSLALLVQTFISKYPDILNYTSKTSVTIRGKRYTNTNRLLNTSDAYYFYGADGFKTGSTNAAGKCLCACALRGSDRVISVVMHSKSDDERYSDSVSLLNYGFDRINYINSNIFPTDIRTFINGYEIPCGYFLGRQKALTIIAEDLNSYGFDTYYVPEENILYIYENKGKTISPVIQDKSSILPVTRNSGLRAVLVTNGEYCEFRTVLSLNGRCCISVDEFASYYQYIWNNEQRTANITY